MWPLHRTVRIFGGRDRRRISVLFAVVDDGTTFRLLRNFLTVRDRSHQTDARGLSSPRRTCVVSRY